MIDDGKQSEKELLALSKAGDAQAYGQLVRRYMKKAYFLALTLIQSHDDAVDISQEAFVRVWRSLKRFDVSKEFFPFYYSTLRNLYLNSLRDAKRRAVPFSRSKTADWIANTTGTDQNMVQQTDLSSLVYKTLRQLDIQDREIILLKDVHGYTYKEIARILSIPQGTVMSRLHTARERFRNIIQRLGYEHA
jgi:RNA polymerase sigma-70 factor, ECF subfamily